MRKKHGRVSPAAIADVRARFRPRSPSLVRELAAKWNLSTDTIYRIARGEHSGRASGEHCRKVTDAQVSEMRAEYRPYVAGRNTESMAAKYDITPKQVHAIVSYQSRIVGMSPSELEEARRAHARRMREQHFRWPEGRE